MSRWVWLDERIALAVHAQSLMQHGGAPGLRDLGLLRSALARPRQAEAYAASVDCFGLAASYTAGIIKDHPFIDGNKRAGFVLGVLFLELNGAQFTGDEALAAAAILNLAASEVDEVGYANFLRDNAR